MAEEPLPAAGEEEEGASPPHTPPKAATMEAEQELWGEEAAQEPLALAVVPEELAEAEAGEVVVEARITTYSAGEGVLVYGPCWQGDLDRRRGASNLAGRVGRGDGLGRSRGACRRGRSGGLEGRGWMVGREVEVEGGRLARGLRRRVVAILLVVGVGPVVVVELVHGVVQVLEEDLVEIVGRGQAEPGG